MQAGAHLEPELLYRLGDRAGATDRAGRAVEGGEEAVACGVELGPAKANQLAPDQGVMLRKQLAPAGIAKLSGPRRRADDVGEEDGRKHAVRLRLLPGPFGPGVLQETL